ncbi:hypothetical protein BDR22DRAFT_971566 [Usnea florida]
MHTILSTFLAISTLGADSLATYAVPDTQPGVSGELGHDANLMLYLWPSGGCKPPADYHTANLSWGSMQPIPATMSFSYSRPLHPTENIDWSGFARDDSGAKGARGEDGLSACAHYLETKDRAYPGALALATSCINLTVVANCVNVWDERHCPPYICHQ